MRWELSEEQRLFQDALQAWLAKHCSSDAVRRWHDSGDPSSFEQALLSEAWLGVGTSEDLGGQGGGLIELALAAESYARVAASSSAWLATVLAVPAFAGALDIGAAVLGKGEFAALAVSADSPPDAAPTVTLDGDRLRGQIAGVLGADRVRHFVVPVLDGGVLRLAHVDVSTGSVQVTRRPLLDRSRTIADVAFEGADATLLDVDAAAALVHDSVDGREPEARAAHALGREERLEDPLLRRPIHADAVVHHLDLEAIGAAAGREADLAAAR